MTKAPVTITEMLPQIMGILESYGYEKHYLWGTIYGNFGLLTNEKYMGDSLLQKTYMVDFLTKR